MSHLCDFLLGAITWHDRKSIEIIKINVSSVKSYTYLNADLHVGYLWTGWVQQEANTRYLYQLCTQFFILLLTLDF